MPPAARVTDMHTCPMVTGVVPHVGGPILPAGHPTTIIGGLPAARIGDLLTCVGPPDTIVKGAPTVLIGMMPAARMGDNTAHGGVIVLGHPTTLIGDAGSDSSTLASDAGIDDADVDGSAGEAAEARCPDISAAPHVLRGYVMSQVNELNAGAYGKYDPFHSADVRVGQAEIGKERNNGNLVGVTHQCKVTCAASWLYIEDMRTAVIDAGRRDGPV